MKKLISLLACTALLVGVVIAAFPTFGVADTAITAPGFSNEAPGTTTFQLGANDGSVTNNAAQGTLTVGEDKVFSYDLNQNLGYWLNTEVYASDNQTAADVREFKYLYVNLIGLTNGYCTNAAGQYVSATNKVVETEKQAKYQQAFLAKICLLDGETRVLGADGKDWSLISDMRSLSCTRIDLGEVRTKLTALGKDADAILGNLKFDVLVYGKQVKLELYASNNDSFVPGKANPEKNATVSIDMSASGDNGTVAKAGDGAYTITGGSDNVVLVNMFNATEAGNFDASAYPYLHVKFGLQPGTKVNSAVLVDAEGNIYKKDGAEVNILGGAVEFGRQLKFDFTTMSDADKAQFLTNLRVKMNVEGSITMIAKVSTREELKLTSGNIPGVTAFQLTGKPASGIPGNATISTNEDNGSLQYNLTGHLAAWVPVEMSYAGKPVNANNYQYLIIDVKSMTDGLCMNDAGTSYAAEFDLPTGGKEWRDVDTAEEAKKQTGFVASFQLSYKNASGGMTQLKKVALDSKGDVKFKAIAVDDPDLANQSYDKNSNTTITVKVGNETVTKKAYYLTDASGYYIMDGSGDWGVAGEARVPMTIAPVDLHKLAASVDENNKALDRALAAKRISQATRDSFHMNLEKVLEALTVRALIYGKQVEIDYYVTNNPSFVPGPITDESVPLGMSTSTEYIGNSTTASVAYDKWTDSNEIENKGGKATTLVANLYALQGAGNMDARNYKYLYIRMNALTDGTKINSIKLVDLDNNILDQNLLGGAASAGTMTRVDLSQMDTAIREQFLENTRLVFDMSGPRANIQAAFSQSDAYMFEDWYDKADPNYAYKLHLQALHIEFNKNDVTFHPNGAVSVNLSAGGAGMHVQDRYGALDATQYKYMYVYLESGAIHDIRMRTSDNNSAEDMKVQTTFSAAPGLTRISLEKLHKEKPRLMQDLCFNLVVYTSTEIAGIWFSNSPTFDPIAMATESDYEVVIGQEVAPLNTGATMVQNLDGSMEFAGKGEAHFKPVVGTKAFNATKLKYLVVDIDSGAKNLKELRLRSSDNSMVKSVTGLKNGLNYLIINQLDERILENLYFAMVVDGKVKISSMWITNEPQLDPNYKATTPEYEEILLESASGYLPLTDRIAGESTSTLTMGTDGMITVSGPKNDDVGLFATCYHNPYSNPPEAAYIKFGVVNRPLYVVAYTYDTSSDDTDALLDVLTVNIQPGVYNDYVRIDLRDSSFYSKGFSGFLEFDIYAPAGDEKGNGVAFTIADVMYQGTGSPALSPVAKGSSSLFVPTDSAQFLNVSGFDWGDTRQFVTVDEFGNIIGVGGVVTGEESSALPVAIVAVLGLGAMATAIVLRRRKREN